MKLNIFFIAALSIAMVACQQNAPKGEKVDAKDATAITEQKAAETYAVDLASSSVAWEGSKPVGDTHKGTVALKSGELKVDGDNITGGNFVIDMASIKGSDPMPEKVLAKLEGHLKSPDFFSAADFPEAKFEIANVEAVSGDSTATHKITGNLTMKGETKSIEIPCKVMMEEGSISATTPAFTINRTDWGVNFGSGVIGTVQDKLISDAIGLQINLVAKK
ncbi:MAG: YceI family protein [Bacteroidota bacterium]